MKETLKLIKSIGIDILKLYKNFVHWNISKLIIFLYTSILSFIFALPFVILIVILYYGFNLWDYLNGFDSGVLEFLVLMWNRPFIFFILIIVSLLLFFFALFWYSYRKILLFKLNLWYLDWNKIWYLKNSYFDFKLMFNYLKVISLIILGLSVPVLAFIIVFFILFFIFWWASGVEIMIKSSQFNLFTILVWLVLFISFALFIYLSYRLYFAVLMLVDEKNYNSFKWSKYYLIESFNKTKNIGNFMKFILIFILISIIVLPFWNMQEHFSKSLKEVRAYREYSLLWDLEKSQVDKSENYVFLDTLKDKYSWYSNENLKNIEVTYFYFNYFLIFLNFILVFWLLEMTYISFYRHQIAKKKSILSVFS